MLVKSKKNRNYPNLTVTLSLTIALFLVGLCGLLTIQGRKLTQLVKQNIEMQTYLQHGLSPAATDSLKNFLASKPYVLRVNGQPQIRFVSKDEAADKFIKDTNEDFKEFLGENPLRDAYVLKISEDYFEEAKLQAIEADLEKSAQVFEADYPRDFADDINRNISKIYLILSGFVVLLLIIVVILVNNTIKLALYSQRFLIRSMQLVGATNGFIRGPFIWSGILQGLLGGLLACGLVYATLRAAQFNTPDLMALYEPDKLLYLGGGLVVLGILISLVSTYQSLERYLRLALDDLY
jgi:cell division transport system permease protein